MDERQKLLNHMEKKKPQSDILDVNELLSYYDDDNDRMTILGAYSAGITISSQDMAPLVDEYLKELVKVLQKELDVIVNK